MRQQLRDRLAPTHEALDQAVSARCLAGGINLPMLLRIHGAALPRLVSAMDAAGAATLYPGWDGAARLAALRDDLDRLGLAPDQPAGPAPEFADVSELAGALYAIEGSNLGNTVILRRVLVEGDLRTREATAYLRHGERGGWPRFVAWLESRDDLQFDGVVRGAERVFACYAEALAATSPLVEA